ncbi:MAG: hypothetical protein OEY65_04580 [Gammaproteobacteria bacterium]|nr:hypothetical protein [Gammaproteobacteria bacterium]
MSSNSTENILITAATVTAELSKVKKIAKEMSIAVMNAKAISHRAGEAALGFRPITDFIDEMAQDVMQLVIKISKEAFHLSQMAVERTHLINTKNHYSRVLNNSNKANHVDSLKPAINKINLQYLNYQETLQKKVIRLTLLLEDIQNSTKGSQVISTTSRVEASRARGYRASLEVVAGNLEQATDKIRTHVKSSRNKLDNVLEILKYENNR